MENFVIYLLITASRGKTRHSLLLLKFLANEENHHSLINACEDLMDTRPTNMLTTRAAARGEPTQYMLKQQHTTMSFYQEPFANYISTLTKYQFNSKCSLLLQSIALLYNFLAKDLN